MKLETIAGGDWRCVVPSSTLTLTNLLGEDGR